MCGIAHVVVVERALRCVYFRVPHPSQRKAPMAMPLKSFLFRFCRSAALCLCGKGQHSTSTASHGAGGGGADAGRR